MCKLYAKITLKPEAPETLLVPSDVAEGRRCSLTSGQRDGFGFVSQFGFWKSSDVSQKVVKPDERLPLKWRGEGAIRTFGDIYRKSWFVLAHSRTSTNKLGVANAHPFVGSRWVLLHNGVVEEREESSRKAADSPNDSARLHAWLEAGNLMKKAHKHWCGYGAILAFDQLTNTVHIWRDGASLVWQVSGDHLEVATVSSDIPGIGSSSGTVPNQTHTVISPEGKITCEKWFGFATKTTIQNTYFGRTNAGQAAAAKSAFPDYNGRSHHYDETGDYRTPDWREGRYNDDTARSTVAVPLSAAEHAAQLKEQQEQEEALESEAENQGCGLPAVAQPTLPAVSATPKLTTLAVDVRGDD